VGREGGGALGPGPLNVERLHLVCWSALVEDASDRDAFIPFAEGGGASAHLSHSLGFSLSVARWNELLDEFVYDAGRDRRSRAWTRLKQKVARQAILAVGDSQSYAICDLVGFPFRWTILRG
jgi:hypothetical protein